MNISKTTNTHIEQKVLFTSQKLLSDGTLLMIPTLPLLDALLKLSAKWWLLCECDELTPESEHWITINKQFSSIQKCVIFFLLRIYAKITF